MYVLYAVTFTREIAHLRDVLSAEFLLNSLTRWKIISSTGQLSTL